MTSTTAKPSNAGMTYGIIGGLVMILITLGLYLGGVQMFGNMMLGLVSFLVIIVIAVMAGLKQRSLQGGYLSFAEALKTVFLVFALAFILQTLFNYVLLNYIDTSFREGLTQLTLERTEEMLKKFNAPESEIEAALARISDANSYSLGNMFLGFGIMCIVFFLISLIIAAIVKKNKPPFENAFKESQ